MERILAPADKVLAEIGRLALVRPWLSGILLLTATIITLLSNNPLTFSTKSSSTATTEAIAIPAITNPVVTDTSEVTRPVNANLTTAPTTPITASKTPPISAIPVTPAKKAPSGNASLNYVSGQISHSLYADARKAGLSAKQANQLVQLFSPKSLAQSMRRGDQFSVLYESPKIIKQKKYSGNILAAQLTVQDKIYQLIRFTDAKGHANYYTPQGQTLSDGLLREPLHFDHISSGFSNNRFDPILHYRRPHLGVDFAAPTGTPVKAAGDGVVAEVEYRGGYGRTVVLKHDEKYSTLYAHLSRFANLQVGDSVQQGQVIGYVGQSGFATGPHLHYEIHVNDVPYNPLTVTLPGVSIPKAYRNQFLAQSRVLLAQLNTKQQIRMAQKGQPAKRS